MRSRLDEKEKELESAQRERDAARASASRHGGDRGDGSEASVPGDDGDVAELENEVRPAIINRKLEDVNFLRVTVSCSSW